MLEEVRRGSWVPYTLYRIWKCVINVEGLCEDIWECISNISEHAVIMLQVMRGCGTVCEWVRWRIEGGGCTVPKKIAFPRYNMKCSGENVILCGIFHVVSCFPLHFMLYHWNLDYLVLVWLENRGRGACVCVCVCVVWRFMTVQADSLGSKMLITRTGSQSSLYSLEPMLTAPWNPEFRETSSLGYPLNCQDLTGKCQPVSQTPGLTDSSFDKTGSFLNFWGS